jgi:hypothetical protein
MAEFDQDDPRRLVALLRGEYRKVASRGAQLEYLAGRPTLSRLAGADPGSSKHEQGEVIYGFIMPIIEQRQKPLQFKGQSIPADRLRAGWVMSLGMNDPFLAPDVRRFKTMQILGVSYALTTWRRIDYEGKFLEALAWDTVNQPK